jgi:Fur family ferric uptake transcriptional regulator
VSLPRRRTRQGAAIHEVIREAGRPLAPAEILDLAAARVTSLSLATVYRQIRRLLEDAAIREVVLPGMPARYEDATSAVDPEADRDGDAEHHHHHFFHCDRCDAVFPVEGCAGDVERLAPPAFKVRRHEVVLYGECERCAGDESDADTSATP